jgi:ATP-dependent DNA helicase RecG
MNYLPTTSAAEDRAEVGTEDGAEVKISDVKIAELLALCETARSRREMQDFCSIKSDEYFRKQIVSPLLSNGLIKMAIPDKPNSRNQKYIKA